MTAPPSSQPPRWPVVPALALLCVAAAVVRGRTSAELATATAAAAPPTAAVRQVTPATHPTGRKMVGGYSAAMDPELLGSDVIAEVAAVALNAHAAGASSLALLATPEEVAGGAVQWKVLEARQQVVAGMNYKLTLAVLRDGACLGGFACTVYKPLPHTGAPPRVTAWGEALDCAAVDALLDAAHARAVEAGQEAAQAEAKPAA